MGTKLFAPQTPASIVDEVKTMIADSSQRILGSKMGSGRLAIDIPNLVDLYAQGRLKLDELVSDTYPLDEINDAIASTKAGSARRNVILF